MALCNKCGHKQSVKVNDIKEIVSIRDVKLEFFSKLKLESKKSIKTRNSFPVVSYSLTRGVLTNDWQHGQESQNK